MTRPAVIILAAGKGSRMKSGLPKAMVTLCGRPLVGYLLEKAKELRAAKTVVVAGHRYDLVSQYVSGRAGVVRQKALLGSGHAVACAQKALGHFNGPVLVLYCDTPLLSSGTLKRLLENHSERQTLCTLLSAEMEDPGGYGRILKKPDGSVERIVEENDAMDHEKKIHEINVGCYCFDKTALFEGLKRIKKNKKKNEYYLTDIVEMLAGRGLVEAVAAEMGDQTRGVNSKRELAALEALAQKEVLNCLMDQGVRVRDPVTTTVDVDVKIGQDTVLLPGTMIEEGSVIGRGCTIGPFARIRGGSSVGDRSVIGNFVEIVRSTVGRDTNIKHLSYIGDALVGNHVNVGAGTITANYDGKNKHRTVIKDGAHLGSGTVLVAPVVVGRNAVTGAGAVVTKKNNIPDGAVVVGVPARVLGPRPKGTR